MSLKHSMQGN